MPSRLVPLLFTVFGFLLLCSLGTWQVVRLQMKNELQARVDQQLALPAEELPGGILDAAPYEYRRMKVEGEWLHEKTIYVFTGPVEFKGETGYFVITPLKRPDGEIILVHRGFVPTRLKNPETRPDSVKETHAALEVMVHRAEIRRPFVPESDPKKGMWFFIDVAGMGKAMNLSVAPYYVRVVEDHPAHEEIPLAGKTEIRLFNPHLQYAITWYSLAIALVVIYVLFLRSARRGATSKV